MARKYHPDVSKEAGAEEKFKAVNEAYEALRETPASNLVFVRSASEADLSAEKERLINICWPVHQAVIDSQNIETILCLGGTAGRWVREVVGATKMVDSFRESNARGWASEAHLAKDGRAVITVTHPGRVDWRNPAADPSPLVRRILERRKKDRTEMDVKS